MGVPAATYDVCAGFLALFPPGAGQPQPAGGCGLNDIVVGPDQWLYLWDDGFGGGGIRARVYRLRPDTGFSEVFYDNPSLYIQTSAQFPIGAPPFGVNGLEFQQKGSKPYLLMANMSADTIYSKRVAPALGSPSLTNPLALPSGSPTVLAAGVEAPDDMLIFAPTRKGPAFLYVSSGENTIAKVSLQTGAIVSGIPVPLAALLRMARHAGCSARRALRPTRANCS